MWSNEEAHLNFSGLSFASISCTYGVSNTTAFARYASAVIGHHGLLGTVIINRGIFHGYASAVIIQIIQIIQIICPRHASFVCKERCFLRFQCESGEFSPQPRFRRDEVFVAFKTRSQQGGIVKLLKCIRQITIETI